MATDYSKLKAVIFDSDGTLVDSETTSLRVLVECVGELGLELEHSECVAKYAGKELSAVFRDFEDALERPLPNDFLQTFRQRQMAVLGDTVQQIHGAQTLLERLSLPYCLASNAPPDKIGLCLEAAGLAHLIPETRRFSAYEIEKWKPDPALFLWAAETLGFPPEHCAVVEDSQFGVQAGLDAGMHVFALGAHALASPDVARNHRVTVISQLPELMTLLPITSNNDNC